MVSNEYKNKTHSKDSNILLDISYWIGFVDLRSLFLRSNGSKTLLITGIAIIVFILTINFSLYLYIKRVGNDGYEITFTPSHTKMFIRASNLISVLIQKIFMIPMLIIMMSIIICGS